MMLQLRLQKLFIVFSSDWGLRCRGDLIILFTMILFFDEYLKAIIVVAYCRIYA